MLMVIPLLLSQGTKGLMIKIRNALSNLRRPFVIRMQMFCSVPALHGAQWKLQIGSNKK